MLNLELLAQLTHIFVVEVTVIVSNNLSRNTVAINYVFLYESCNHLSCNIRIGSNFNPICEVVNGN